MKRTGVNDDIKYIIENFDFQNVHQVMTLMDWRWFNTECVNSVPTVDELKELSGKLLRDASGMASKSSEFGLNYACESGGLRAEAINYDGEIYLSLSFVVESWDNYGLFEE